MSEILKWVKKKIGKDGITTGADLEKIIKPMFGSRYRGIVQWLSARDVPPLKEGEVALLNKQTHWTAAFRKGGKLEEVDSYGRDLLGSRYKDDKVPRAFLQPLDAADCGQRTLTLLIKHAL